MPTMILFAKQLIVALILGGLEGNIVYQGFNLSLHSLPFMNIFFMLGTKVVILRISTVSLTAYLLGQSNLIGIFPVESIESCHNDDINNQKIFLSITFGAGLEPCLNRTPEYFNFATTLKQSFTNNVSPGTFSFVNMVSTVHKSWHNGALDYTDNDINGYMFLINFATTSQVIFKTTINNLCIGSEYLFSAYMGNVARKNSSLPKPNVTFEVWSETTQSRTLAQRSTNIISDYDTMIWTKYNLTFNASSCSVVLLMISGAGISGNDLAIDDIELRACPTVHCDVCSLGQ